MRVEWEEYALNLAESASIRSEDPFVKVGACALGSNHRVLSVGYNGLAPGISAPKSLWEDRDGRRKFMIHAEANCLSLFRAGECSLLAVTLLPCSYCATLIAGYEIPKVIYRDVYERDTNALQIFDFYGIKYEQISKN
tara:strand:+ start:908 stop:1321 length:414 start_codon:yes stop_codon:yes gene_type:complete